MKDSVCRPFQIFFLNLSVIIFLSACGGAASQNPESLSEAEIPEGFHPVQPVEADVDQETIQEPPAPEARLEVRRGRFFSYVLPERWTLGEDGQFALSMMAPDQKAITLMVGNAGLFPDYPPAQFVYDKLMAIRPENLQIGEGQSCEPVAGFQYAVAFPVSYQINGQPCRGQVKCHVAPYYGGATMAITAALSDAGQWAGYSSWLPLVADQISAIDGAAFGMRGVMQQNLETSRAYAEAARQYREWSQRNWKETTDYRNAVQDRQQREFRENLGAVQTWSNPYDNQRPIELGTQYEYYWVNRQGQILGTDNPGVDPNQGSTSEWQRMEKKRD